MNSLQRSETKHLSRRDRNGARRISQSWRYTDALDSATFTTQTSNRRDILHAVKFWRNRRFVDDHMRWIEARKKNQ